MSVASCIFTILHHLILLACTIVCMRTPLKRSPVYILMCAVFSWAILNKYMYYYIIIIIECEITCVLIWNIVILACYRHQQQVLFAEVYPG